MPLEGFMIRNSTTHIVTWWFSGVNLAEPGQLLYIVCPDKTVVEDDNSQPVWVTPGTRLVEGDNDGYANVGPGMQLRKDNSSA